MAIVSSLSQQEKEVLDKLIEAHNLYAILENQNSSDIIDWCNSMHNLQRIISTRVARRTNPDVFITIKNN